MARKPTKGYFVKGHFVAAGSELDQELKRELKGDTEASKTDLKKHSEHLQQLGEQLLTLRSGLLDPLGLPDSLLDALTEARRISDFEGRRRQIQYIGKLMRKLDAATVAAIEQALVEQHQGSAKHPGQAARHGKSCREIYQLLGDGLAPPDTHAGAGANGSNAHASTPTHPLGTA